MSEHLESGIASCVPATRDLAVVVPYFETGEVLAMRRNREIALHALERQGVPLFTITLAIGSRSASASRRDFDLLSLHARDVLWHKERLVNIAVAHLPRDFTKVAWIDADVLFPDATWYARASALLETSPVIQPFAVVDFLDARGRPQREVSGFAHALSAGHAEAHRFGLSGTWPGLAWAARREVIADSGLFDESIVGGGDTLFALAASRHRHHWAIETLPPRLRASWERWRKQIAEVTGGRLAAVPTRCLHLWHGDHAQRQYVDRIGILARHAFDPAIDLRREPSGVWAWATAKDALHADVEVYFDARNCDD